ncbi:hypothetical protein G0018_06400, partial [Neisseria meningitidis]|nr:hypothetical protein [Neisseria meningitidis]
SDAELLAILLRVGTRGMSAVDLARYLLQEFGSLNELAPPNWSTQFPNGSIYDPKVTK